MTGKKSVEHPGSAEKFVFVTGTLRILVVSYVDAITGETDFAPSQPTRYSYSMVGSRQ